MGNNALLQRCIFVNIFNPFPEYNATVFLNLKQLKVHVGCGILLKQNKIFEPQFETGGCLFFETFKPSVLSIVLKVALNFN